MASVRSPFRFAWVNPGTSFNAVLHDVEDEKILSFRVEQNETEFATLSIDIKNPRIGLLNAGRKLWAYLSWFNGSTLVPLFFGRLVGIPTAINKEVVSLEFIARPTDFATQKATLGEYMRDLPNYDPVFISPDKWADPDVVLEAIAAVWHIDRVTHEVSTSDLITGEDGAEEFLESEVVYESVDISLDQPPIKRVRVEATVPWTQTIVSDSIPFLSNYRVSTLAGSGLEGGWPKAGDDIGGGWFVTSASAKARIDKMADTDFAYNWFHGNRGDPFELAVVSSYSASAGGNEISISSTTFVILRYEVFCELSLACKADRDYSDMVVFEVVADTQPIVTDPGDDEKSEIIISGNDVGKPLGLDLEVPIGVNSRRSYFAQERGQHSLQYLIQLARAQIIVRSRAVKIKFKCNFVRGVEITLRKNVLLHDRRIPGGQCVGKVVNYNLSSEGGAISCEVTMACAIGYGGSVVETVGDGVYAAAGYMASGYQFMENNIRVLGPSDVGFTRFAPNPNDDGLTFPIHRIPLTTGVHVVTVETKPLTPVQPTSTGSVSVDSCGNTTQISINGSLDTGPYSDWLGGIKTTVEFSIREVEGGPFDTIYPVTVTQLSIPKQIDLEAPSV